MPSFLRSPLRPGRLARLFAALVMLGWMTPAGRADDAEAPKKKKKLEIPKYQKAEAEGGSLRILNGIPVLHVKGTPEQIGRQVGALLKDPIAFLLKHYFPHFIQGKDHKKEALVLAHQLEKNIPGRFIAEMKACAAAAGVEYEDLLLANVSPEVFEVGGCSAVAVGKPLTLGGQVLFGRNLDWNGFGVLQNFGLVTAYEPEGQQPFVSIGYPGMFGCVTAMNDAGLCIADLVVLTPSAGKDIDGIPYLFLLRRLAEEAKSAEAAETLVRNAVRTVPHNIFVADTHTARLFECEHQALQVRKPEADVLVATNYFQENVKTGPEDPRYDRLCKCLGDKPALVDVAKIQASLKAANLIGMNLHSVVMQPETKKFHLAQGKIPAAACPFQELHWDWCFGAEMKFDPAPEAPPGAQKADEAATKALPAKGE